MSSGRTAYTGWNSRNAVPNTVISRRPCAALYRIGASIGGTGVLKPWMVIVVVVLACCCISTEPVGPSENCSTRSVIPRIVGESKPFSVDEFVTVRSGSAWHAAVGSAHGSGAPAGPPVGGGGG